MTRSRLLFVAALAAACGPQTAQETGGASESDAAGTSEAGDETTAPTTTAAPLELTPDEQLCVDRCLHWQEGGCPWFDEGCYGGCIAGLEQLAADPCEAETRASLACELLHPLDESCEAVECRDVYLQQDLCRGFCYHLGGWPSSGGSQEDCHWGGDSCYGHDLEMTCTVGDAPECSCKVDTVEVSTCTLGMKLGQFSCGGDDFHIFSGCCTDAFLEAIQ